MPFIVHHDLSPHTEYSEAEEAEPLLLEGAVDERRLRVRRRNFAFRELHFRERDHIRSPV